jgi:hypothetical protein
MRPIAMHAWVRYNARLAAALGLAAVAAAGYSSAALAAPAHLDGHVSAAGRSCSARHGWAAITLADRLPAPEVTVPLGAHVVVTVPRWGTGTATGIEVARSGILREDCTVVLPDRGRRTIFLAARTGSTRLSATVAPASNLFMPAWSGEVTVRSTRG